MTFSIRFLRFCKQVSLYGVSNVCIIRVCVCVCVCVCLGDSSVLRGETSSGPAHYSTGGLRCVQGRPPQVCVYVYHRVKVLMILPLTHTLSLFLSLSLPPSLPSSFSPSFSLSNSPPPPPPPLSIQPNGWLLLLLHCLQHIGHHCSLRPVSLLLCHQTTPLSLPTCPQVHLCEGNSLSLLLARSVSVIYNASHSHVYTV